MARISKQPSPAPKTTPSKPAAPSKGAVNTKSSMPPAPKPTGTWVTGDNGTPDVYVPPSQQNPGTTTVTPKPPSTVTAKGTIAFGSGWQQSTSGDLVAGGKLTVDYDMGRFSSLLTNSVDGNPAWNITAYVQFQPSGQIAQRDLVDFSDGTGSEHGTPRTTPQSFDIPAGTTGVQVWFKNWSGADEPREAYDSNFGKNYRFDVRQPS